MRVVRFSAHDLGQAPGGGGSSEPLVPVDKTFRQALTRTLTTAESAIAPDWRAHPDVPGILVFKLRENGIAKTHRPLEVASAAELNPAGHGRLDEMLVATDSAGIAKLKRVIAARNTKAFVSDLSAIEYIEGWDRARRCGSTLDEIRERGSALLRPFSFWHAQSTKAAFDQLLKLLSALRADFSRLKQVRGPDLLVINKFGNWSADRFESLMSFPALRRLIPEPVVRTAATDSPAFVTRKIGQPLTIGPPLAGLPAVGIFDSGVAPSATQLTPWIASRQTYVVPPETDYIHGTSVASLVAAGAALNDGHAWFPAAGAMVHDVAGVEQQARVSDVLLRLREEIASRRDVHVWNISLGAGTVDEELFSEFAMELDALSARFNVLFVVSAGNYLGEPRRGWPDSTELRDSLFAPADAVFALTVGSIVHTEEPGQPVAVGSPAPYSRRGPGPVFTPKPDVLHVGGGVHLPWAPGKGSVRIMGPGNQTGRAFGTSYAAPLASCLAAHTWHSLDGRRGLQPSPAAVKALMLHAAQLNAPVRTPHERKYFGAGLATDVAAALYDGSDSFTLIFEVQLSEGSRWRKAPYPIPASLVKDGKLRAEILMTAVYTPPTDPNAGAEYVRANVELGFGTIDASGNFKGQVPWDGEKGQSGYEKAQIENGGKWSPVKQFRKSYPEGRAGNLWAVQAIVRRRALEPPLAQPVNAVIIVTLRSIDGSGDVYSEGSRALAKTNWIAANVPARVPIRSQS